MKEDQKQYDIVILLCASEFNANGKFDELASQDGIATYLGGQVRMDAAVDFAPNVKTYFVVGGSEKKVTDMKNYLENKLSENKIEPRPKIIRIRSDPDTNGNLWAVKLTLRSVQKLHLFTGKVGIMTNFYHLPRTMRFAVDVFRGINVHFIPVAAEAVITRNPTYSLYQDAFLARIASDIKGLKNWEDGEYAKQTKRDGWYHECLDKDILAELE